ncbi:MAG: methionine biosynthesis protein MetW [Nanoarchaeota archaeon]|nr:methionine biosynthesis protein MetW [Nanoarchaeota archaeon]
MNETQIEVKEEQKRNRFDYTIIVDTIPIGSKVLDLGCGIGTLLKSLKEKRGVEGRGIEIKQEKVKKCVERGLSVLHGDLDEGLKHYKSKSFDYVIFNETIQVVHNSLLVLKEALRVGKKVIVSFPNFGHWQVRLSFALSGKMPKSRALPYEWYNTPNIRELTVKDFRVVCKKNNIHVIKEFSYVRKNGNGSLVRVASNFFATNSLFVLEQR